MPGADQGKFTPMIGSIFHSSSLCTAINLPRLSMFALEECYRQPIGQDINRNNRHSGKRDA